jgi:hypothetical protein
MKQYLRHRSKRWSYDSWALLMPGATRPLTWTVSTTREEVRQLRDEYGDMFTSKARIVKVRINLELVEP